MKYENHENYPPFVENLNYGFFGYPSAMLNLAITKDDCEGFNFYFERYFTKDAKVLGAESVIQHVKSRGAEKIAAMLENANAD